MRRIFTVMCLMGGLVSAGVLKEFNGTADGWKYLPDGGSALKTIAGGGIELDGDSLAGGPIAVEGAFSITMEIKPLAVGAKKGNVGSDTGMFVASGSGYYDGFRLYSIDWPLRRPMFEIGRSTGGSVGVVGADSIPEGDWCSLAAVYDGKEMRIYVNGMLSGAKPCEVKPLPGKGGLRLGFSGSGIGGFKTVYRELKIYDEVLSGERILASAGIADAADWTKLKALRDEKDEKIRLAGMIRIFKKTTDSKLRAQAREYLVQMVRSGRGESLGAETLAAIESFCRSDAACELSFVTALARTCVAEGRTDKGVKLYAELAEKNPGYRDVYAQLLWQTGQKEKAADVYRAIFGDGSLSVSERALAGLAVAKILGQLKQKSAADAQYLTVAQLADVPAYLKREALRKGGAPETKGRRGEQELPKSEVAFFVSPDGDDAAPGTKSKPFASFERARAAVRTAEKKGGVTVFFREGVYPVTNTVVLSEEDSGLAGAPVVYRNYGSEKVVFDAGFRVKKLRKIKDDAVLARLPEEARGKVYGVNLYERGLPKGEPQKNYGYGLSQRAVRELFLDGKPLIPARWPNEGFVKTGDPVGERNVFAFEDPRAQRWGKATELIANGFWYHLWAVNALPAGYDAEKRQMILRRSDRGNQQLKPNMPFFVLNLLEEIDVPGEWFFETATGMLYLYPPKGRGELVMSCFEKPFLQGEKTSHLVFSGLEYRYGAEDGFVFRGGSDIRIENCRVDAIAGGAFTAMDVPDLTVYGNTLTRLGHYGMDIRAGNRKTLTPGGVLVENNEVGDFARLGRVYNPAIRLDGVAGRVAYNDFHHGPSSAIRLEGNDHMIEFNRFEHLVTESDDQGAIDMWCDPSYRGNVIRYNIFRDVGGFDIPCGQAGVRFDDAISGCEVYGNWFERSSNGHFGGVQIHGGQYNIIDGNVFKDCRYGVSFSPWGDKRWAEFLERPEILSRIYKTVDINGPLYSERYPELKKIKENPNRNSIWRNVYLNCEAAYHNPKRCGDIAVNLTVPAGMEGEKLPTVSPLAEIPLKEIGRYK